MNNYYYKGYTPSRQQHIGSTSLSSWEGKVIVAIWLILNLGGDSKAKGLWPAGQDWWVGLPYISVFLRFCVLFFALWLLSSISYVDYDDDDDDDDDNEAADDE